MNPDRHASSHYDYFKNLIKGDDASAEAHRTLLRRVQRRARHGRGLLPWRPSASCSRSSTWSAAPWDVKNPRRRAAKPVRRQDITASRPADRSKASSPTTSPARARPSAAHDAVHRRLPTASSSTTKSRARAAALDLQRAPLARPGLPGGAGGVHRSARHAAESARASQPIGAGSPAELASQGPGCRGSVPGDSRGSTRQPQERGKSGFRAATQVLDEVVNGRWPRASSEVLPQTQCTRCGWSGLRRLRRRGDPRQAKRVSISVRRAVPEGGAASFCRASPFG